MDKNKLKNSEEENKKLKKEKRRFILINTAE